MLALGIDPGTAICGYGFVDICRNPQIVIDNLNTAFVKNAMAGSVPRYFKRQDGGVNEEEFLDLSKPLVSVTGNVGEDSLRKIEHNTLDGNYIAVLDRTIQQAIAQRLIPIYEPLFSETSFGYRPNRSAQDAIIEVKKYAEKGYTFAVVLDLSKYFDTLNHNLLLNILRRTVKDERVVQLIKR